MYGFLWFQDGSIILFDAVTIQAPYRVDDCLSDNDIVMTRVRQLISSIPDHITPDSSDV